MSVYPDSRILMKEVLVLVAALRADANPKMVDAAHLVLNEVLVPECPVGNLLSRNMGSEL